MQMNIYIHIYIYIQNMNILCILVDRFCDLVFSWFQGFWFSGLADSTTGSVLVTLIQTLAKHSKSSHKSLLSNIG